MRYGTEFLVHAAPVQVFDAVHIYKIERNPTRYFLGSVLGRILHMSFRVVSPNTLGVGATYDWRFTLLGLPIFHFREQVIEWEEGRLVAYRALSAWNMEFRTQLEPANGGTRVKTLIEFSTGLPLLDRLAKPFLRVGVAAGLRGNACPQVGRSTTLNAVFGILLLLSSAPRRGCSSR